MQQLPSNCLIWFAPKESHDWRCGTASYEYADELESRCECVMAISAWRTSGLASLSARAAAAAVVSRPHSRSQDPEGSVGCSC